MIITTSYPAWETLIQEQRVILSEEFINTLHGEIIQNTEKLSDGKCYYTALPIYTLRNQYYSTSNLNVPETDTEPERKTNEAVNLSQINFSKLNSEKDVDVSIKCTLDITESNDINSPELHQKPVNCRYATLANAIIEHQLNLDNGNVRDVDNEMAKIMRIKKDSFDVKDIEITEIKPEPDRDNHMNNTEINLTNDCGNVIDGEAAFNNNIQTVYFASNDSIHKPPLKTDRVMSFGNQGAKVLLKTKGKKTNQTVIRSGDDMAEIIRVQSNTFNNKITQIKSELGRSNEMNICKEKVKECMPNFLKSITTYERCDLNDTCNTDIENLKHLPDVIIQNSGNAKNHNTELAKSPDGGKMADIIPYDITKIKSEYTFNKEISERDLNEYEDGHSQESKTDHDDKLKKQIQKRTNEERGEINIELSQENIIMTETVTARARNYCRNITNSKGHTSSKTNINKCNDIKSENNQTEEELTEKQHFYDGSDEGTSIAFEDDGIKFEEGENESRKKENLLSDVPSNKKDSKKHKIANDYKFDLKLLKYPIVYTKKLDLMNVFKNTDFHYINDKSVIERALLECKPVKTVKTLKKDKDIKKDKKSLDESQSYDIIPVIKKVKYNSWLLKKPTNCSYNPIQVCKNPDFNTRLKRITSGFFNYMRNRALLKICKPLTIDLHKAFEKSLLNGTMYLKADDFKREKVVVSNVSDLKNYKFNVQDANEILTVESVKTELLEYKPLVTSSLLPIVEIQKESCDLDMGQKNMQVDAYEEQYKSNVVENFIAPMKIETVINISNHISPVPQTEFYSDVEKINLNQSEEKIKRVLENDSDKVNVKYNKRKKYGSRNCVTVTWTAKYAKDFDSLLTLDTLNKMLYIFSGDFAAQNQTYYMQKKCIRDTTVNPQRNISIPKDLQEMKSKNNKKAKASKKFDKQHYKKTGKISRIYCCYARKRIAARGKVTGLASDHDCARYNCGCCCRTDLMKLVCMESNEESSSNKMCPAADLTKDRQKKKSPLIDKEIMVTDLQCHKSKHTNDPNKILNEPADSTINQAKISGSGYTESHDTIPHGNKAQRGMNKTMDSIILEHILKKRENKGETKAQNSSIDNQKNSIYLEKNKLLLYSLTKSEPGTILPQLPTSPIGASIVLLPNGEFTVSVNPEIHKIQGDITHDMITKKTPEVQTIHSKENKTAESHLSFDHLKNNIEGACPLFEPLPSENQKVTKEISNCKNMNSRKTILSDLMELDATNESISTVTLPPNINPVTNTISINNYVSSILYDGTNSTVDRTNVTIPNSSLLSIDRNCPKSGLLDSICKLRPELNAVTSCSDIKYICENSGKLFSLDTKSGKIAPIQVSIKISPNAKRFPKSQSSVDLTNDTDAQEQTVTYMLNTYDSKDLMHYESNNTVKPIKLLKTTPSKILKGKDKNVIKRRKTVNPKKRINIHKQKRILKSDDNNKKKLDSYNDSSDDEPLVKKSKKLVKKKDNKYEFLDINITRKINVDSSEVSEGNENTKASRMKIARTNTEGDNDARHPVIFEGERDENDECILGI